MTSPSGLYNYRRSSSISSSLPRRCAFLTLCLVVSLSCVVAVSVQVNNNPSKSTPAPTLAAAPPGTPPAPVPPASSTTAPPPPGSPEAREPTPAEKAAIAEVQKRTQEVLRLTEDVHSYATTAIEETEKSVIEVATEAARHLAGLAARELERGVKSTKNHPSVVVSLEILREVASNGQLTDSARSTKLETVERQLFEAPQQPSIERAIEFVESARREVDIAATERALSALAQTPGIIRAQERLKQLANSYAKKNRDKSGRPRRLSKREQAKLVDSVLAELADETQTSEIADAHALVTDIKKSLLFARTTIAKENEKVVHALDELEHAPQVDEVKKAIELMGRVERRLADPTADTRVTQQVLSQAEHELSSLGGTVSGDVHVKKALAAIQAARHDEEMDEARNQLELSLISTANKEADETLQQAHQRLLLVQQHAHDGSVPKEALIKELEAVKKDLSKLPKEVQTTRTDHAEQLLDNIFQGIQLDAENEKEKEKDPKKEMEKLKQKKRRLTSEDDIHDEDDRLALAAIKRATEGLNALDIGGALGGESARKALEEAATLIDSTRKARSTKSKSRAELIKDVSTSRDKIVRALDGLAMPTSPAALAASEELKNAKDYLEHELALLALGEGQDGTGTHSKTVTHLLQHANAAIHEAHKEGDSRVAEAQELLLAAVRESDDPTSDPAELRAKIETAERLLAGAALSQIEKPTVQSTLHDEEVIRSLQAIEAAQQKLREEAKRRPASSASAERVQVAMMEMEDAKQDLLQPGRSRARQTQRKIERAQETLRQLQLEDEREKAAAAAIAGLPVPPTTTTGPSPQVDRGSHDVLIPVDDPRIKPILDEHKPTEYAVKFLEAVSKRLNMLADKEGLEDFDQLGGKDKELVLAAQLVDKIHHVSTMEKKQELMSKLESMKLKGMTALDRRRLLRELDNRLIDAEQDHQTKLARTLVEQQLQHAELTRAAEELRKDPEIKDNKYVQDALRDLEHVIRELEDDMRKGRVDAPPSSPPHPTLPGQEGSTSTSSSTNTTSDSPSSSTRTRLLRETQLASAEDALAAAPKSAAVSRAARFVERVRMSIMAPLEHQSPQERQLTEAADMILEIAKAKNNADLQRAEEMFMRLRKSGFMSKASGSPKEREERMAILQEIFSSLEKAAASQSGSQYRIQRVGRLVEDAMMEERMSQTEQLLSEHEQEHGENENIRGIKDKLTALRRRRRHSGGVSAVEMSEEMKRLQAEVDSLPDASMGVSIKSLVHDMADAALNAAKKEGGAPEQEITEAIEELNSLEQDTPEIQAAKETLAEVLVKMREAPTPLNRDELRALLDKAAAKLDADHRQHDPRLHRAKKLLDLAEAQREVEAAISIIFDAAEYSPALKRALKLLQEARTALDSSTRGASFKASIVRNLAQAARRIERSGIKNEEIMSAGVTVHRAIAVLRRHDDELLAQRQKDLDRVEELITRLKDLPALPQAKLNPKKRSEVLDELQRTVQEAKKRRPGDEARRIIIPAKPTVFDLGLGLEIDEYQNCTNAPGHHLAGRQCVPDAVCTETTCNQHGLCSVVDGSVTCLCDAGFITVGNRFCSACAGRSAVYPDCFTRDLTDDYVRDSLSPDVCTAPLLPTTLNGPGLLHTALRTLHIHEKYFINTATNSHVIRLVVPEESLLRVHIKAMHPDLFISERQVTIKLALPESNMIVHQGTKFFGQQESLMSAIIAPGIVYGIVFEYDGQAIAAQAASRGDQCPTFRVEIAVTAASTLGSYKDTALQDALLESAHLQAEADGAYTSLPKLDVAAQPDGVPQDIVQAVARGDALPSHLAAQAAGHGACVVLPNIPKIPLESDGHFHVPPSGYYHSEQLAVMTGMMGRGVNIESGVTGSVVGPSLLTGRHSQEELAAAAAGTIPQGQGQGEQPPPGWQHPPPDFDSGVENAIYMLPFTIPEVSERHAYIETELEYSFVYGVLRMMLRNDKTGMMFLAHTAINSNRIRVPLPPGSFTLIIMLLKPHPAPVPEHPSNLPHMQGVQKALSTVTMPECMMYTFRYKIDFVAMPELPPGERLTKEDLLTEDCQYNLVPPHLNVPGFMGYHGKRLHLFETFRYDALRPLRFIHFELTVPSVARIAVPSHHNHQDVTVRLVRLDHPFDAQYDTMEDERRAKQAAEDKAFEAAEAEEDVVVSTGGSDGQPKRKQRGIGSTLSDAISGKAHIQDKVKRHTGANAKLISMGYISKKRKVSTIVAELEPGSYRLDLRTPRERILAPTETQCEGFTMEMTIVPEDEAENMSHAQCRSSAPHAPAIPNELFPGVNILGAKAEAPVTEVGQEPMDMASALLASSQKRSDAVDEQTLDKLKKTAKAKSLQYSYVAHVPYSRWNDRKPITSWEFWVNEVPVGETGVHLQVELEADFSRVPLMVVLEESLDDRDKAAAEAKAANAAAEAVARAKEGAGIATGSDLRPKSALDLADEVLGTEKALKQDGWPALMVDKNFQVLRRHLKPGLYRLALYLLAPGRFSHMSAENHDLDSDFACVEYDLRLQVTVPSQLPMVDRCMHRTPTRPGLMALPRSLNTLRFLGSDMLATQGQLSGKFAMPRMLHLAMPESSLMQRIIQDQSHLNPNNNPNAIPETSISRMEIVLPAASLLRISLDSESSPVVLKLLRHMCIAKPGEPFSRQPLGQATRVQPWGKYDMQREMGRHTPDCVHTIISSASGRFSFVRFLDPGLYEIAIEQSGMSVTKDAAAATDCLGYYLQVAVSGLHALEPPEVLPDRIFPPHVLDEENRLHAGRKVGEYADPEADEEEQARERKLHPNYRPYALLAELNRASNFIPLCPNLGSDHFPPSPPKHVRYFYFYDSIRRNEHLFIQQRHKQPRVHAMRFKTDHPFRFFAQVGFNILTTHLTVTLTSLKGIDSGLLEYQGYTRANRHTVAIDVAPAGDWLVTIQEAPSPLENDDNLGVFCSYFTYKVEIEPLHPPSDALVPAALGIPAPQLLLSALQRVLPRYPQLPYTLNSPAFLVPHHAFHHFAPYSLLPMARRTTNAEHAAIFARNEFKFVLYHKTAVRILVTPAVRHHLDGHFSVRLVLDCTACDPIVVGREVTVHNTRLYSWLFGQLDAGHYTLTFLPRTAALPHTWFTARGSLDVQLEMAMAPVEHILRALPHPCPQRLEESFTVCKHIESMWVQRAETPNDALTVMEEKAICAELQGRRVYTLTLVLREQSTIAVSLYFDFLMTALMPSLVDVVNEHRWHGERLMNSYQLFAVVPAGYYNITIDSLGRRIDELLNDHCLRDTYGLSVQISKAPESDSTSWLRSQKLAHEQLKRDIAVSTTGQTEYSNTVHRTGAEVDEAERREIWAKVAELQGKVQPMVIKEHHADMPIPADITTSTGESTCPNPIFPHYLLPIPPSLHGGPAPPEATHPAIEGASSMPHVNAGENKARETGETEEEKKAIDAEEKAQALRQPLVMVHTPGSFVHLSAPAVKAASGLPSSSSSYEHMSMVAHRRSSPDADAAIAAEGVNLGRSMRQSDLDRHDEGTAPSVHRINIRSLEESLLLIDLRAHSPRVTYKHVGVYAVDDKGERVNEDPHGVDMVPRQVYEFIRGARVNKLFWLPSTHVRSSPGPYQYVLELGGAYDGADDDDHDEITNMNTKQLTNGHAFSSPINRPKPCHSYSVQAGLVPLSLLQNHLLQEQACTERLPPRAVPFDNRGKASVYVENGIWHSGKLDATHHTKIHRMTLHVMEDSLFSASFAYPFISASFRLVVYQVEDDGNTYELYRARPSAQLTDAKGQRVLRGVHPVPLDHAVTKDTLLNLDVKLSAGNYHIELQEQLSTVVHELLAKLHIHRAVPNDASEAEKKLVMEEATAKASKPLCVPYTFALALTPAFLAKEHTMSTAVILRKESAGGTQLKDRPHGSNPIEQGACQAYTCGCRNMDVFTAFRLAAFGTADPNANTLTRTPLAQTPLSFDVSKQGVSLAITDPSTPTSTLGASSLFNPSIPYARMPEDHDPAECIAAGVCLASGEGLQTAMILCHCSEGFAGARCERCDASKGYGGTYPHCVITDPTKMTVAELEAEAKAIEAQRQREAMEAYVAKAQSASAVTPTQPSTSTPSSSSSSSSSVVHPSFANADAAVNALISGSYDPLNLQPPHPSNPQGQGQGQGQDHVPPPPMTRHPSHITPLGDIQHDYDSTGFDGKPIIMPSANVLLRAAADSASIPIDQRIYCDQSCLRGYCDYRTGRCVSYTIENDPAVQAAREAAKKREERLKRLSSDPEVAKVQERLEVLREETEKTTMGSIGFKVMYLLAGILGLGVVIVIVGNARRYLDASSKHHLNRHGGGSMLRSVTVSGGTSSSSPSSLSSSSYDNTSLMKNDDGWKSSSYSQPNGSRLASRPHGRVGGAIASAAESDSETGYESSTFGMTGRRGMGAIGEVLTIGGGHGQSQGHSSPSNNNYNNSGNGSGKGSKGGWSRNRSRSRSNSKARIEDDDDTSSSDNNSTNHSQSRFGRR